MEKSLTNSSFQQIKQARLYLILLTGLFFIGEVCFNYLVLLEGDGDVYEAGFKTLIFLLLIYLFSKSLNWAKWVLSISLVLYGILCLLAGLESSSVFYIIGFFDIFFGVYIHKSKSLSIFRTESSVLNPLSADRPSLETSLEENPTYEYPFLVRRYKAILIDGLLLFSMLISIMLLIQKNEMRTQIMLTSALILFLTYEPLLTAYSKTLGQKLMRIRVGKHTEPQEKISLVNSYIRWATKGLLGWLSFITIHFNKENRAIHDIASDSVMINDD